MSDNLENNGNDKDEKDCGCEKFSIPCRCVDGKPTFPKIPKNG